MIGFRFLLNRAFGVCARLVFTGRLGHNPLLQMAVFFTFCLAAGLALLVGTAKAGTPRRGVRTCKWRQYQNTARSNADRSL
jgi:hypothetical protein